MALVRAHFGDGPAKLGRSLDGQAVTGAVVRLVAAPPHLVPRSRTTVTRTTIALSRIM